MNRRRITLTLGAAAGGLLGAALGPAAFAFADDLSFDPASYTFDPVSPETVTGLYNMANTAPPGVSQSIQGYQLFDVNDGRGPVGSFYAYESTAPYLTPHLDNANDALFSSEVLYVSPDAPGYQDPTGIAPTAGSVISTTGFGGAFENIYSAIPSGSTDTVTDTLKTPFGNIDLSNLVNSLGFDAANVTPTLPDHITSTDDPVITGVNGLPPLTIALQGYQPFEWDDNPADAFNAVETTTTDGFGFHTEALLVTQNTGTGDNTPPVGSVFNTIDFHNLSNVYSSMPSTTGGPDTVTDILTNPQTGQTIDLSSLFASADASAGLTDGSNIQSFDFGDYTIQADPNHDEVFTGIN